MDERVAQFIGDVAQTMVGLGVALYLQSNPNTFDTAAGFAVRLRYPVEDVETVINRFAEHDIVRKVSSRDGAYYCYSLNRTAEVWNLLCLVSEAYIDDPETRIQIARMLVRRRHHRGTSQDSGAPPPLNS